MLHCSFLFLLFRYKKDQDIGFLATCSLHNLLNATLLSESGPPLLDFEVTHGESCLFFYPIQFIGFTSLTTINCNDVSLQAIMRQYHNFLLAFFSFSLFFDMYFSKTSFSPMVLDWAFSFTDL